MRQLELQIFSHDNNDSGIKQYQSQPTARMLIKGANEWWSASILLLFYDLYFQYYDFFQTKL